MSPGPIPFPTAPGVPIVGQPFTLQAFFIPVTAVVTCNCGGADTTIRIVLSAPAACPSCGRQIGVSFNPRTGQLEVAIVADVEQGPAS